jgi:hypothetical protein
MIKQALQFFKSPPRKLAALIELVNGFPSDLTLRRAITPEALKEKAEAEGHIHLLAETIVQAITDLPDKLQHYISMGFWDGSESIKWGNEVIKEGGVVERYSQLWDAYLTLREIARRPDKEEKPALWILYPLHNAPVFLEIDSQGILRDVKTLFFQVIADEEIKASRIRECPICKSIFWAGRITQKCCSPRCANRFRVHRHRYRTEEEKVEYELRRARREEKRRKETQRKAQPSTKKGK